MFSERPPEGRSCVRCFLASSIWRRSALERDPTAATNLREVVLSDTAPGSDAVSPGPSLRSTLSPVWKGEVRNRREQRVGAWPRAGKTLLSYSLLALKYNDLGVSQVRG